MYITWALGDSTPIAEALGGGGYRIEGTQQGAAGVTAAGQLTVLKLGYVRS